MWREINYFTSPFRVPLVLTSISLVDDIYAQSPQGDVSNAEFRQSISLLTLLEAS